MVSTTGQQEHNENAQQLGGTNFVATKRGCVSAFDVACDVDAYEASRISHQKAEDLTVAEQGRMVREGNLDPSQVTSNKAFAAVAQKRGDGARAESKAKARADALFLAMIDQLRDLQDNIAAQYGEDYALDLLSEIETFGIVDQEMIDNIRAITDVNEQRDAIARLYFDLIEDGKLSAEDVAKLKEKLPWITEEWERLRRDVEEARDQKVEMVRNGQEQVSSMDIDSSGELESTSQDKKISEDAKELAQQKTTEVAAVSIDLGSLIS